MLTNDELRNYIYERFFNKTPVVEENGDPTGQDTIEPVEPMVMERDSPKQKEYTYLSDDLLSLDAALDRDFTQDYVLHLCFFNVVTELDTPFLKFLLVPSENNTYGFPSKPLEMGAFREIAAQTKIDNSTTDESSHSEEFQRQYDAFMKEIVGNSIEDYKYRGFLEENNQIYAFFDCTSVGIPDIETGMVCIVDEIINHKKVVKTPTNTYDIIPELVDLFNKYPFIRELNAEDKTVVPYPKISYMCENIDPKTYKNVYDIPDENNEKTILLDYPTIEIENDEKEDDIETGYLFSMKPLDNEVPSEENALIRRFALFIEDDDASGQCFDKDTHQYCSVLEENDNTFIEV